MFYGTTDLEYYPETNEAVFVVFKKRSRKALIIGYSSGKSRIKICVTEIKTAREFFWKDCPMPVHEIYGINKRILKRAFEGSFRHQRALAKIVESEFYEKILGVLTCRLDYSLIEQQTMQ